MSFRAVLGVVGVAVAAGLPCPTAAHTQEAREGVYTAAHADRGRRIFGAFCATCHGVELEGVVGPALTGSSFSAKWSRADRSVQDLYDLLCTTMPHPVAGTLAEASYLQVLAYLLSRNGVPPGDRELAASTGVLRGLRIPASASARPAAPEFIPGDSGTTPTGGGPTQSDLARAGESTDWLYHTHDYAGTRYTPLRQITPAKAGRLRVACAYQVGSIETFVTGPLVWQDTIYLTTA